MSGIATEVMEKLRAAVDVLGIVSQHTSTNRDNELHAKADGALSAVESVINLVEERDKAPDAELGEEAEVARIDLETEFVGLRAVVQHRIDNAPVEGGAEFIEDHTRIKGALDSAIALAGKYE